MGNHLLFADFHADLVVPFYAKLILCWIRYEYLVWDG